MAGVKHNKFSVILYIKGFCMGIADIIPGISGGTIALILGIYEQFINAIRSIDLIFAKDIISLRLKKAFEHVHWLFLVNLVAGILTAIIVLSKVLEHWLESNPELLFSFFFGLILATIPLISQLVKKWDFTNVSTCIIACMLTFWIIIQKPVFTEASLLMIFVSGFIAISAMILPGISGSFILLLMGQYRNIIQAINNRDYLVLIVFVCGICLGVLTIVRILSWLFKRYHDLTIAGIIGVIIGSLPKIWPWKDTVSYMVGRHGEMMPLEQVNMIPELNSQFLLAIILFCVGFILAFVLNRMPQRIEIS